MVTTITSDVSGTKSTYPTFIDGEKSLLVFSGAAVASGATGSKIVEVPNAGAKGLFVTYKATASGTSTGTLTVSLVDDVIGSGGIAVASGQLNGSATGTLIFPVASGFVFDYVKVSLAASGAVSTGFNSFDLRLYWIK